MAKTHTLGVLSDAQIHEPAQRTELSRVQLLAVRIAMVFFSLGKVGCYQRLGRVVWQRSIVNHPDTVEVSRHSQGAGTIGPQHRQTI